MNKNDIVEEVVQNTSLTRSQVIKAIDGTLKAIKDALVKGNTIKLHGFATIRVVRTPKRVAFLNGKKMTIHSHKSAKIKISNQLKKLLNNE